MDEPRLDPHESLLKIDEVCLWFRVTKEWVYDEVEADRLPCVRLGRRTLRFDPQELRDYLRNARNGRRAGKP